MKYFCSQCQKKHDVGDIAADMLTLCDQDILDGILNTTGELIAHFKGNPKDTTISENLQTLQDNLISFINFYLNTSTAESLIQLDTPAYRGTARLNGKFAVKGSDVRQTSDALAAPYHYTLTLDQVYALYKEFARNCDEDLVYYLATNNIEALMRGKVVCNKDFIFEFFPEARNTLHRVYQPNNNDARGNTRLCPHCGRALSFATGTGEEIVVALAGAPRAGKTSCMVSMLSTLHRGEAMPDFVIETSTHDEKWANLMNEINNYRKCCRVTKTEDNILEVPGTSFKMKIGQNAFKVITIVDMPGEFWVQQNGQGLDEKFLDMYAGLYENIDCIWFAISKATIQLYNNSAGRTDAITQKLDSEFNETIEQISKADPHVLRENLSSLRTYLNGKGKEMPPFLVMLSKPDFFMDNNDISTTCKNGVYPLVSRTTEEISYTGIYQTVSQANRRDLSSVVNARPTRLNEQSFWAHANDVRRYIKSTSISFLRAIEDNCPKHFFMSVSAYGCSAQAPSIVASAEPQREPVPYHELYPLIWTLAVNNCLPVSHNVTVTKKLLGRVVGTREKELQVRFDANDSIEKTLRDAELLKKKPQSYADAMAKVHVARNLLLYKVTCDKDLIFHDTSY